MNDKSQVNIFGLRLSRRNIKQYIVKYTSDVITRVGYILLVLLREKLSPLCISKRCFFFVATCGKCHGRLYLVHMVQHLLFRSLFKNRRISSQTLVLTIVNCSG